MRGLRYYSASLRPTLSRPGIPIQPDARHRYYAGWRDALHVYGGIPTLTRPTIAGLQDYDSEVLRVIRESMGKR